MAKMEWEKAAARDKQGSARSQVYKAKREATRDRAIEALQLAMATFVSKHHLVCFACGEPPPRQWAKTGVSNRGRWALCSACREAYKR